MGRCDRVTGFLNNVVAMLARGFVKVYRRLVSPMFPPSCRFQPTCSGYALEAIEHHGGVKGVWLALRRVGRCHPWGGQGFDPVPEKINIPEKINTKESNCHCHGHKLN